MKRVPCSNFRHKYPTERRHRKIMNNAEVEEEDGFSEWEEVHYSPRTRTIQTTQIDKIAATPNSPVLQPSLNHEPSSHLHITPSSPASPSSSSSSSSSSSDDFVAQDDRDSAGTVLWRVIVKAKKRLGNSAIFHAVQRILLRDYAPRGWAFWSFVPAAGALGAILVVRLVCVRLAMRWCRGVYEEKLNRLVSLLKEKDQKIRQLVLQIAQLNELLSSRRRVRVIRIA